MAALSVVCAVRPTRYAVQPVDYLRRRGQETFTHSISHRFDLYE